MTHRPIRASTALAATLAMILPQVAVVPAALAQERIRLCADLASVPPCPEGEPRRGAPYLLGEDGSLTAVRRNGGEEGGEGAAAEDAAPEDVEADAEADGDGQVADEAQAQADAEREAAAQAQAEAEAAQGDGDAAIRAEAEAAAQAEADALAEQAASEEQRLAQEADQAQAEADARAEAEAEAEAQAEADGQAEADAQARAERRAARAEEQARAEAQAQADAEAQAEADGQADAEAEANAQARAERRAARAEEQARAEADAQADADNQARADADVEETRAAIQAEREARRAARQAARQADRQADRAEAAEAEARAEEEIAAARAEAEAAVEARAEDDRAAILEEEVDRTIDENEAVIEALREEQSSGEDEVVLTVTEDDVRTSDEDFDTVVRSEAEDDDDRGLSDLEKALLVGLGAVAVGSLLNDGGEVVANSGDRVVTRAASGEYEVFRDDDALLRQEGATVRTQTFDDGSTRTIVDREDGTQIVTIRDAEGRVLRRARVLADGTQVVLLDDTEAAEPVDVRTLREAAPAPLTISIDGTDQATLRRLLEQPVAYDPGRSFTLRQIREIAAVRDLVPGIDLDSVTFPSGSAAIPGDQLDSLVDLGFLIEDTLLNDASEVFLIEGHTDATGGDALNLALSDRRAETVALALTENFDIPPENLVVQGYGEEFLKVLTDAAEERNRRATVRRITPLLQTRG